MIFKWIYLLFYFIWLSLDSWCVIIVQKLFDDFGLVFQVILSFAMWKFKWPHLRGKMINISAVNFWCHVFPKLNSHEKFQIRCLRQVKILYGYKLMLDENEYVDMVAIKCEFFRQWLFKISKICFWSSYVSRACIRSCPTLAFREERKHFFPDLVF